MCSARPPPAASAGTFAIRPARYAPRDSPAARAPAASCRPSVAVMRIDSLMLVELDWTPSSTSARPCSPSSASPRSRATALRTNTDTLTRSACARATRADFKPRISTVTKLEDEVFIGRRMKENESLVKLAAHRLSLHSPMHSVFLEFDNPEPMISGPQSSQAAPLPRTWSNKTGRNRNTGQTKVGHYQDTTGAVLERVRDSSDLAGSSRDATRTGFERQANRSCTQFEQFSNESPTTVRHQPDCSRTRVGRHGPRLDDSAHEIIVPH